MGVPPPSQRVSRLANPPLPSVETRKIWSWKGEGEECEEEISVQLKKKPSSPQKQQQQRLRPAAKINKQLAVPLVKIPPR